MAWTNIHDEFLARNRHKVLSMLMSAAYEGWDEGGARALGQLAFLWGNSQAAKTSIGTAEEIVIWSQLYPALENPEMASDWIQSLCHAGVGVLREIEDDKYEIVGNTKAVEYRLTQREKSKLGGQKNKERWEKLKLVEKPGEPEIEPGDSPRDSQTGATSIAELNEMKLNEMKEENTRVRSLPNTAPDESPRKTIRVKSAEELRSLFASDVVGSWCKLYSIGYYDRETEKAFLWLQANPAKNTKTRRAWQQFISGWLDRGWGKHTAQIPSNGKFQNQGPKPVSYPSVTKVLAEQAATSDGPRADSSRAEEFRNRFKELTSKIGDIDQKEGS